MKIALVNTNLMRPPIAPVGLEYLAEAMIARGHEVSLVDLCLAEEPEACLATQLAAIRPELVGITVRNTDDCYFTGQDFFLPRIKRFVEITRETVAAPIVLGGVGYSVAPGPILDYLGADLGIAGEGEAALDLLAAAVDHGGGFEQVPGLVHRSDGQLVANSQKHIDLAALPPRQRTLADNRRYFAEGGQAGFETKRGCGMACIYCADPVAKGRTWRLLPPEMVVREIRALLDQGIDHLHTCDSEFNLPADHGAAVCEEIIRSGLGQSVHWYAYCSPSPFTPEMAELFVRAGCAGVDFGVDSGDEGILAGLARHFHPAEIRQTAKICRRFGIHYMFDLLIGGPGETRESVRRTIGLMKEIDAERVGVAIGVRVYPGTRMARIAREQPEALHGSADPELLRPVFYLAPELGPDAVGFVRELVGDDPRFFLPVADDPDKNYNYNDNSVLVEAIGSGYRGAYWDILRRLASEHEQDC